MWCYLIFLLSVCTDELIAAQKIMTIFPILPYVKQKSERESNPTLQPLYLYLIGSAFLGSFTDPNKQLCNVKSVLNFVTMNLVRKRHIYSLLIKGYKYYLLIRVH